MVQLADWPGVVGRGVSGMTGSPSSEKAILRSTTSPVPASGEVGPVAKAVQCGYILVFVLAD